jgi:hypothetical protein
MQLYQKMYQLMLTEEAPLFSKFKSVHDRYTTDPVGAQKEFNTVGGEVLDVIRIYERKLCGRTESGQYGKFSANLSQKFWDEIKKVFPKINFVGAM